MNYSSYWLPYPSDQFLALIWGFSFRFDWKNQPPCWVTQRKIKGNSTQNPAITSIPGHLNNPLDPQPPQITWKIKFLITVPAYSGQRAELETHPGTTCLCDAEDILLPLYYRDNSNFQSCKLWKMLVEHSALWRRVPDTLQGMYGLPWGKFLMVSTVNPGWPFLNRTHIGLPEGGNIGWLGRAVILSKGRTSIIPLPDLNWRQLVLVLWSSECLGVAERGPCCKASLPGTHGIGVPVTKCRAVIWSITHSEIMPALIKEAGEKCPHQTKLCVLFTWGNSQSPNCPNPCK